MNAIDFTRMKATTEEINAARNLYEETSGDLEIDGDARCSVTEDGVWVAAWVWVPSDESDNAGNSSLQNLNTPGDSGRSEDYDR